jgi:hypothetical protein
MTGTAAKAYYAATFDDRVSSRSKRPQAARHLSIDAVIGIGTMAAACAFVTTVALAATWLINNALATAPNVDARAQIGAGPTDSAKEYSTSATADAMGPVRITIAPLNPQTFEAKWARAVHEIASFTVRQVASRVAATKLPVASNSGMRVTSEEAPNRSMSQSDPDGRIAVYDIAAHTVFLPNGDRLEAHSGRDDLLDDPRYVSVKDRGPTPPNIYDLALRQQLFHGVAVIRLNPVGAGSMFNRDGILAHPYLMGANGQSNGCVSFKDYPAFLQAYLRGEVDRLVVVPHLANSSWRTVSALREPTRRYAEISP